MKHNDDLAVDAIAQKMKAKLAKKRADGRGGWETCSEARLSAMLVDHINKGDPVDVANFCAMLSALGFSIVRPDTNTEVLEALEIGKRYVEASFRPESHEGTCGPWADCDGNCMDNAHVSQDLSKIRAAIRAAIAPIRIDSDDVPLGAPEAALGALEGMLAVQEEYLTMSAEVSMVLHDLGLADITQIPALVKGLKGELEKAHNESRAFAGKVRSALHTPHYAAEADTEADLARIAELSQAEKDIQAIGRNLGYSPKFNKGETVVEFSSRFKSLAHDLANVIPALHGIPLAKWHLDQGRIPLGEFHERCVDIARTRIERLQALFTRITERKEP